MGLSKVGNQIVTVGGSRSASMDNITMNGLCTYYDAANPNSYTGSGATWYDLTIIKNNGTLTNGPTFDASNGGGLVFDGVNQFMKGGRPKIPVQGPGTMSVTAKYTNLSNVRNLATITDGNYAVQFGVRSGNATVWKMGGAVLLTYSMPVLNTIAQWVMTFNGPNIQMYINGALNASTTTAANQSGSNPIIYLGTYADNGSEAFPGTIYNTLVYNRVLSADEVASNYNAVRGRYGI